MNIKEFFALKRNDRKTIDLYCRLMGTYDGYVKFGVINGGWTGRYYSNGNVTVDTTGDLIKGVELVWESDKHIGGNYNEAMYKIDLELGYKEVTE